MFELKLTKIGNSVGLILSKEILAKLRVGLDSKIFAVETSNGIELTPYNPEFAKAMALGEEIIEAHKDVLKKLAE